MIDTGMPRYTCCEPPCAGCIAYELLAQRPFMPPRCSVTDHQARVAGLALMDLSPVNVGFQSVMRQLLSGTASIRPSATAFQGATYFQVGRWHTAVQRRWHRRIWGE